MELLVPFHSPAFALWRHLWPPCLFPLFLCEHIIYYLLGAMKPVNAASIPGRRATPPGSAPPFFFRGWAHRKRNFLQRLPLLEPKAPLPADASPAPAPDA